MAKFVGGGCDGGGASNVLTRKGAPPGLRGSVVALVCLGIVAIMTDRTMGGALGRQTTQEAAKPPPSLLLHPSTSDDAYALAYKESGGFFDDLRERDWAMLKERVRTTPRCSKNCGAELPAKWYQNNWEPSFTCLHERRVGRWGDGGKWVCDPHRIAAAAVQQGSQRGCLVYSVGSNNDFSFEEAVLAQVSQDCEVHTFDPTVGEHPSNLPAHGKVQFHPWGLAEADKGDYKTLATIQRELGHAGREVDVFKIDCEGCEWNTFESWFEGVALAPRQVLIELHLGTEGDLPVRAMRFMSFLKDRGYVIFHKESNTLGCNGKCIEYAFLRLDGMATEAATNRTSSQAV